MRNITAECRATVKGRWPHLPPLPPRGVDDCDCMRKGPMDEFILVADKSGVIVWYARKSCPIHGITVTDLSESPPMDTSSEPSTTES